MSNSYFEEKECINCKYSGQIRLADNEKEEFYLKVKNHLCNEVYVPLFKPLPVARVIGAICGIENNQKVNLSTFLSYYRIIKNVVIDLYQETTSFMIEIFYANETLTPYLQKVEYEPGIYDDNKPEPYFKDLIINGWRATSRPFFKINCDNLSHGLKLMCRNINFKYSSRSPYPYDFLEFWEIYQNLEIKDFRINSIGLYSITFDNSLLSKDTSSTRLPLDSHYRKISNENEYNRQSTSLTPEEKRKKNLRELLYTYIKDKTYVTWPQICAFMQDKDVIIENKIITIFDIFMPLYQFGLIDVCTRNNTVYYFAPNIKLKTSIGTIKLTKNGNFKQFFDECSEIKETDQALEILKEIPPLEQILRTWTKINRDPEKLIYMWNFGLHDNVHTPKFIKKNPTQIKGLCRDNIDKMQMSYIPSYFKFNNYEIYQIPRRDINPNAERIAKFVQRSILNINDRILYNKKNKILTCYISDIPIPVLRALFVADPIKLGNGRYLFNNKEINKTDFTITDEIYEEIKRIFTVNVITEED